MTRFFLLAALIGFFISCQPPTKQQSAESFKELHGSQQDTNYINELLDRSEEFWSTHPDSSRFFAEEAVKISQKRGYLQGLATGNKWIGMSHYSLGDNFQALRYWETSMNFYDQAEDLTGKSNMLSNIGAVYQMLGEDSTALNYFNRSLTTAKVIKDSIRISTAYFNLGTTYANEEATFDQAISLYLEALKTFEEIEYASGQALALLNIGELLLNQNKLSSALEYFNKALNLNQVPEVYKTSINYFLGEVYSKLNNYQLAEEFYKKAIAEALISKNKFEESRAYQGLGRMYLKINSPPEAISNFNKASNEDSIVGLFSIRDRWKGLVEAYFLMNDLNQANNAFQQYEITQDSLINSITGEIEYRDEFVQKMLKSEFDNQEIKFAEQLLEEKDARVQLTIYIAALSLFILFLIGAYFLLRKSNKNLDKERERSEQILLNILPEETAKELKLNGIIKAKQFDQITVLFTDFKGFSVIAEKIEPGKLVDSVDYYFRSFDSIIDKYRLEKIKTIGDSYMCAGGIPSPNSTHAEDAFRAAIDIRDFVEKTKKNPPSGIHPFEIRIGLNTGPVVAGVVGTKKFAYDIWGNTVNLAARMESNSEPGKINVSESTFELLKDKYDFSYRGEIEVKNGLLQKMYFAEL